MRVVQQHITTISTLLVNLRTIDLGYPLGKNEILEPGPAGVSVRALIQAGLGGHVLMRDFYSLCNGVSLPDVHVGYFVHKVTDLHAKESRRYAVQEVRGQLSGRVTVFGSTGGGDLIAVRQDKGDVLYLPTSAVNAGIYEETVKPVKLLGATFDAFLQRLACDIEAFIKETPGYDFIG